MAHEHESLFSKLYKLYKNILGVVGTFNGDLDMVLCGTFIAGGLVGTEESGSGGSISSSSIS